jgi:hypothetical protein
MSNASGRFFLDCSGFLALDQCFSDRVKNHGPEPSMCPPITLARSDRVGFFFERAGLGWLG